MYNERVGNLPKLRTYFPWIIHIQGIPIYRSLSAIEYGDIQIYLA